MYVGIWYVSGEKSSTDTELQTKGALWCASRLEVSHGPGYQSVDRFVCLMGPPAGMSGMRVRFCVLRVVARGVWIVCAGPAPRGGERGSRPGPPKSEGALRPGVREGEVSCPESNCRARRH